MNKFFLLKLNLNAQHVVGGGEEDGELFDGAALAVGEGVEVWNVSAINFDFSLLPVHFSSEEIFKLKIIFNVTYL